MKIFDSFKNLFSFGTKRSLGVDIGTTTIKVVELMIDRFKHISLSNYGFLENYGHLERINDAFQTSGLKLMETDVASILKGLLEEAGFREKTTGMSIPVYSAFVTTLEFPQMPDQDLVRAIPYSARQVVPLPLEEVVLDWIEVSPSEEEKVFRNLDKRIVFLVAIAKEIIERYKRIAEMAGLNLVSLELESLSQGRALLGDDKTTSFILDIGSRVTSLMLFDNGYLRMNKFFDLASGDLSEIISKGLRVDVWRAERIKKEEGLLSRERMEINNLIYPTLDAIIKEAKNLMNSYKEKTGKETKKIILAGATANMPGLIDYLSSQFGGKRVEVANAFAKVSYRKELEPLIKIIRPSFPTAVGSAIRILTS